MKSLAGSDVSRIIIRQIEYELDFTIACERGGISKQSLFLAYYYSRFLFVENKKAITS